MIYNIINHLVIDYRARDYHLNREGELINPWCLWSYPGHSKGCPNYGKKEICPPNAPLVDKFFDLSKPHWFIIVSFDLGAHVERMFLKHPDWSMRQARCVLYWQGTANKSLRLKTEAFCKNTDLIYTYCPEAMGVHCIKTAKSLGIPIKTRPKDIVYKMSMVGYKSTLY